MVLVVSEPVSEPRLTQLAISYYQKEQSNRMFIRTIRDEWSDWRELSSTDQLCNPNLLDNWYFPNPVNQRGLTEYTAAGYTVDRWAIGDGSSGTLSLTENGLKITRTNGIMYLTHSISKTQIPEGITLTYSALTTSGLSSISFTIKNDTYHEQDASNGISLGWNYTPAEIAAFTLVNNTVNSDVTILAAKLELGGEQTLAHKENGVWVLNEIPDYGEQLRRCQRYLVKLGSSTEYEIVGTGTGRTSSICGIVVPIPVTMRAIPVAILSGQLILRNRDDANIVCTSVTVDVNGAGAMYLACTANDVTVGASYDAYLAPGNYLYLGADL